MMKKNWLRTLGSFVLLGSMTVSGLVAQAVPSPLTLTAGDVLVEAREDGFHLFIRQVSGAASVLLTETYELPNHKLASYAFRSLKPNAIHAGQQRLLDGKFLKQPHNSLIMSTLEDHPSLGKVFHVLVPPQVEYGNPSFPNSRYGLIDVQKLATTPNQKFWFSIRVFAKPYADYTGSYHDNAYELFSTLVQKPQPSLDNYEKGLFEDFSRLGNPYRAKDADDALAQVRKALEKPGDSLDIVLCVDTTKSMIENIKIVKANLLNPIRDEVKKFKSFRIGMVFYRDYMEEYLTRDIPFSADLDAVQRDLNKAVAEGGGDIPEAVVEALWEGLRHFDWQAENRVILLMGDAPQHPSPRGTVTEAMVRQLAHDKNVELQMIMLPQTAF